MISCKVKGIILAVIISLASIMMPFSVYADTISNSNVNINYHLVNVSEVSTGHYMQTYDVDFIFDKSYLGWISSKLVGTYVTNNTVPVTTSQFTVTKSIYVNGSIATTSFTIVTENAMNGGALQSLSQSIQNSNVTPLADLSTLDDILNVLNDINNNVEIDVIEELQNIVANTSLSNDYLELISKIRSYDIPFESLLVLTYFNSYHDPEDTYLSGVYDFKYPVYKMSGRSFRLYAYSGHEYKLIVLSKSSTVSHFNNNFNIVNSGLTLKSAQYSGNTYFFRQSYLYLMTYTFECTTTNNFYFDYIGNDANYYVVPLYYGDVNNKNISTDFALRFGLSNSLLDNIQTIANGTTQSNSAASNLENEASEYSDIADDVIGVEEGLTSNFETNVNQIDLSSGLNVFGGNFMTSATWVRTQFDRLTENTPYGSLVVYGLTLGFALLMLGKVFL